MKQKADNNNELIINAGHNEPMEEGNYTILSEAESGTKTWRNNKQNRVTKCMSLIFERFQRLLAMLDEFTERQIQNGRLIPDQWLWWMIVKPDAIDEYKTNLDDEGKEELGNTLVSQINSLFWMLIFICWAWVYIHRLEILSFGHINSFSFIGNNLYQRLLSHWKLMTLVCMVYWFGTRRKTESITEKMARIPGVIAVAVIIMITLNGVTGYFLDEIPGNSVFTAVIVTYFITTILLIFRIYEEDPDIFFIEGTGIPLGLMLGVLANIEAYGKQNGISSGIISGIACILGIGIAGTIREGLSFIGWLVSVALVILWTIFSGILLWNTGIEIWNTILVSQ